MAAHLAIMGFETTLYNRTFEHIATIHKRRGIDLTSYEGGPHGFGRLRRVTSDPKEALKGANVVMVVTPSSAHSDIAQTLAPHLKEGQIVILHPGRTCGAIEFVKVLGENDCEAGVIVAEAGTFLYASRSEGPAQARIFRIKETVPLAALPATRTQEVLDAIASAYPQYIDGENVLATSLDNMGAIFHPALTILNAGRIESTFGDFQFYIDGVTPSVAHVLEALDRERVTVASCLGIRAQSALEWLEMAYNVTGSHLYEAIHNNAGYLGIKAPHTLEHRYIFEDVPMSLVPIAALGLYNGVKVRAIDSVIRLACIIHQTDYWRRGRTLDKLGIDNMSVGELMAYVEEGTIMHA
jgi:opine dehydrogenase